MTTRPEKLSAVPERFFDTKTADDTSILVDGTTHTRKERPKKRHLSLNSTTPTTNTNTRRRRMRLLDDDDSSCAAIHMSAETSTTTGSTYIDVYSTCTSTNSGKNIKAGANKTSSTVPPSSATKTNNPLPNAAGAFLPRDASSCTSAYTNVGVSGGGKSRKTKRWAVEEEKKLVSAVEIFGTANSWAQIAANVPGRNDTQCSSKGWSMYRKDAYTATATAKGAWTEEEEKKRQSLRKGRLRRSKLTRQNQPGSTALILCILMLTFQVVLILRSRISGIRFPATRLQV